MVTSKGRHEAVQELGFRLKEACGGYNAAVRAAASASRTLWAHVHTEAYIDAVKNLRWNEKTAFRDTNRPSLLELLSVDMDAAVAEVMSGAISAAGLSKTGNWGIRVHSTVFNPRALARIILGHLRSDADLRYALAHSIRKHYSLPLSERTAHCFSSLARVLNGILSSEDQGSDSLHVSVDNMLLWRAQCRSEISKIPGMRADDDLWRNAVDGMLDAFLEVCRNVGYLNVSNRPTRVRFRTSRIDSEYLLSQLFGVPTNIVGLDRVFGGGGIVLPEATRDGGGDPLGLYEKLLPPRVIVLVGARGTGKSVLAAQLAAELAQRGGISWLMPLEQSPGECLYTLATTAGLSPEAVAVAVDFNTAATALEDWREDRGALLLLKPDEEPNDSDSNGPSDVNGPSSLDKFLDAVAVSALGLSRGNVRLLVVDPLNNRMPGVVGAGQQAMRQALLGAIRRIKQSGTNVLLVVEEQSGQLGHFGSEGPASDIAFAENVADIIVRLSTRNRHNYSTRYLEVKKSRTQREQRGEHAFSIKSGEGVVIVPSVASVHARSQSRSPAVPTKSVEFGLSCVDEMLGHGTLFRGDLLVLQGPRGCYKTQIALPFLLGGDVRERGRGEAPLVSLLFAARDSVPAVRDQLARLGLDDAAGRDVELRIVPLPRGHVQPGRLLQLVENEFERLAIDGKSLHRLAIDNVNLWESSSPEVAEDATFAVTLVELLRGYRRTCLLVCDDALQTGANGLQDSLAGLCDTLLRFERYEFRGAWRVGVRVLKSRGMSHRLENFEVVLEDGRVVARPSTSLLRVTAGRGTVEPVPIRLFFRVESEVHRKYYEAFRDALKLSVSPTTSLESQDRAALVRQMGMGDVSVIDELQIMEIDEFQLRSAEPSRKPDSSLAGFSLPEHWVEQRWAEHLPRFSKKCEIHSHDPSEVRRRAFAVPFYANIGLMAYDRRGIVDPASLCSWEKIAKLAWEWEQAHRLDDGVFFEYPRGSAENYNCLFWEILLSQIDMKSLADGWCPLRGWLNSKAGIRAAALLRLLCRRAYKVGGGEEDSMRWMAGRTYSDGEANDKRVYDVSANAIVYRHWYSTLNEMMRALSSSADGRRKLEELTICELPGGIAISGEWYLGISAHSAAPRAGLSLIEALTTRDAELNRVRLGVGLPTRYQYYACGESERQLAISPYFSMEARRVRVLVEGAFSRSSFQCYEEIGPIVAHHVCRLIQQSGPEELSFAEAEHNASVLATTALAGLVEELDYLQSGMYATRGRGEKFRCPLSKHCFHNVMFGVSDVTATQRRGGTCSAGCINRSRQQTEQEPVTPL